MAASVAVLILFTLVVPTSLAAPTATATIRQKIEPPPPELPQPQPQTDVGLGTLVNSLLASLLQQTLYNRMENLILDAGTGESQPSSAASGSPAVSATNTRERKRIVNSAVKNYQDQDFARLPKEGGGDDSRPAPEFTKLAGYWIRVTPEPLLLASSSTAFVPTVTTSSPTVDYGTEQYKITDLFTTEVSAKTTSTTTTPKPKSSSSSSESSSAEKSS